MALLQRHVRISSTYLLMSSEKRKALTHNIKPTFCKFHNMKSLFVSTKQPGHILGSQLKHQGH